MFKDHYGQGDLHVVRSALLYQNVEIDQSIYVASENYLAEKNKKLPR